MAGSQNADHAELATKLYHVAKHAGHQKMNSVRRGPIGSTRLGRAPSSPIWATTLRRNELAPAR
eukprot:7891171-Lingulodinium_polyedra.AAC.1